MTGCEVKKIDGTFRIPLALIPQAFEDCKKLIPGAWVEKECDLAPDLDNLVKKWGWKAENNEDCLVISGLERPNRRIGDDEFLFEKLAPYSEDGSYLKIEAYDDHTKTAFSMMWNIVNHKLVCQFCN